MAHVAADCGAAAILTDAESEALLARRFASDGVTRDNEAVADVAALPRLRTDWMTAPAASSPQRPTADLLFLQYTSGSTNDPKGVMVSHASVLANCDLLVDHPKPVVVSWLPQHHDMGLIGCFLYPALSGGCCYGFSPATFVQRPLLWLQAMTRYRATAASGPNFAYEIFLNEKRFPDSALQSVDLSSLKQLTAAAEPIDAGIFDRFARRFAPLGLQAGAFGVAYGLAEFTLAVANRGRRFLAVNQRRLAAGEVRPVTGVSEIADRLTLMSCGRPLGDTQVRIVNPDTREALGENRVGEIWLAGDSRCSGYWNRAAANREMFEARLVSAEPARFLRTGDMGFMRDGELFVCGRLKDMIIVRGLNHYPQDIERLVEDGVPGLRRGGVAAFEVPGPDGAALAIVAEVANRRGIPEASAVVRAVAENLNLHVGEVAFVPPRSIAKTSSGKIRRFRTREMLLDGELEILEKRDFRQSAAGEDGFHEIAFLKRRYGLTGEEDATLLDAGIDSVDLVTFLHWLKELVAARGAGNLAEGLDVKMLGAVSVRQVFAAAAMLERGEDAAVLDLRRLLADRYARHLAEEKAMMMADRNLPFEPPARPARGAHCAGRILLTGGTGFLGPFLLESLLRQTAAGIVVLARGRDGNDARSRVRRALSLAAGPAALESFDRRVEVVHGDIAEPRLGLSIGDWARLIEEVDTVFHNGALVNYLLDYRRMRAANVFGTQEMLRLAFEGRPKCFNHISTTFIFGWATADRLHEVDRNDDLKHLDFGYSQSKWVSEQLVHEAMRRGLAARIFRPALIAPSLGGGGESLDIAMRLLGFMIRHGLGSTAANQVSFVPADLAANNIAAVAGNPSTVGGVFHVVRDRYERLDDITGILTARTGIRFAPLSIAQFVPEVIRRCTRADPLFPLLDFLVGSADNISAMEFKLYDSAAYRAARDASPHARQDPPLETVVDGMLDFLRRHNLLGAG
jgi:thioester reductase-like protein